MSSFFVFITLTVTILTFFLVILTIGIVCQVFFSIPFYKNFRDNDKIEKLLVEAVDFYARELGIKGHPVINMHFKFPKIYKIYHGFAGQNKEKSNTYEVIIMMNHNKYSLLSTLAHEMIHVKQMANKELEIDQEKNVKKWKGVDHTFTPYNKQPWEIEAFKNEEKLARKFVQHKNIKYGVLLLKINNLILSV
jgi:hypothetical protein